MRETNFPCGRIPNNLSRYSAVSEAESNFLLLKWGLCIVVTSSPKRKWGKKITLPWRNLTNTTSSR